MKFLQAVTKANNKKLVVVYGTTYSFTVKDYTIYDKNEIIHLYVSKFKGDIETFYKPKGFMNQ